METKSFRYTEQGFTLIETIAALVIFLITLGFTLPMFSKQHLDTINNEINMGAVAVSQRILDQQRQKAYINIANMGPSNSYSLPSNNPLTQEMGKGYSATITYCPITPTDPYCNANATHINFIVNRVQMLFAKHR